MQALVSFAFLFCVCPVKGKGEFRKCKEFSCHSSPYLFLSAIEQEAGTSSFPDFYLKYSHYMTHVMLVLIPG